ncbi:HpcH/HpaI aldolase family protein [Rhodococcus sp. 5G237]
MKNAAFIPRNGSGTRSRFREIIREGRKPIGTFVMSSDPNVTLVHGHAGYDWVLIDCEHGIIGMESVRSHLLAAAATGLVPIVRVLENNPTLIQQALDAGAGGIVIPKVSSADDVRRAVAASRYEVGGRGTCSAIAPTGFTRVDWPAFQDRANQETVVIPLIESRAGLSNIDEILDVDGIDHVFFGPSDLAQDLGIDMLEDAAELIGLWETVVDAAHSRGVLAGAPLGFGFDQRADFGTVGSDLNTLRSAAESALDEFRKREVRMDQTAGPVDNLAPTAGSGINRDAPVSP